MGWGEEAHPAQDGVQQADRIAVDDLPVRRAAEARGVCRSVLSRRLPTPSVNGAVRRKAATGVGIVWLAAAAGAPAQTPPLALVSPTTPTSVEFSKGVAPLTVVVANNTNDDQTLKVRYVGAGGPIDVIAPKEVSGNGLKLVALGSRTIARNDATVLRLEFRRSGDKPTLDGAIVISAGANVVAVPISESTTPAIIGFEQKSASITTTSWGGPVSRVCHLILDHCPGDGYSSRSTTVAAHGVVKHKTLIGADSGDNAKVAIEAKTEDHRQRSTTPKKASSPRQAPSAQPVPPPTRAEITAVEIPNPGTYSGDVAVDPEAAEPKTIAVTVHARDAIVWPFAAVGLGVLLSWLLIKRREPTRSAQGLRVALQEAARPYLKRRAKREQRRPDRDYLDHLFIRTADGNPAPERQQYPAPKKGAQQPPEDVPALYWETYKVDDADKRANLEKRVATMVARFGRWVRLDDAYVVLEQAAKDISREEPIYDHAQSVLDLAQGEPADDDEVEARAAAMTSWATICALYQQVRASFAEAERELGSRWADQHESLKAQSIYDEFAPADTPEKVAGLRLALLRARRLLVDPARAPVDKRERTIVENLRESSAADLGRDLNIEDILGPGVFSRLVGPLRHRFQSAEDIRRTVREWDWIVFGAVSFLTALAYTLGFYAGKDWGTLTDYVTAIVAGATVPTVINWALLPSDRPLTTAKANSDGG
jgi:hypothetical protein